MGMKLKELALLFTKLGFLAFGGPAAHIAMLDEEVVSKRKWMKRQHFLDLMGATNLIPGPNSTQMVMHIGFEYAKVPGLLVAGTLFILPAAVLTALLAWFYVTFQQVPQFEAFIFGIKPAVIAVILAAVYKLGQKALKGWKLAVIGILTAAAVLLGINPVIAIIGGGITGMLWFMVTDPRSNKLSLHAFPAAIAHWLPQNTAVMNTLEAVGSGPTIMGIFLSFVKIAMLLFGSGYVLVAYLEGEFVLNLGWLTQQQLLDAVAIGQFTPGPVLTTATFIGWQLAGLPGAVVATLGIFLPSFVLVGFLNPVIPKLRKSRWAGWMLDAVNISAVGIMAAVTVQLGMGALTDWRALLIFALSTYFTFFVKKAGTPWIIAGSIPLGWLLLQI